MSIGQNDKTTTVRGVWMFFFCSADSIFKEIGAEVATFQTFFLAKMTEQILSPVAPDIW